MELTPEILEKIATERDYSWVKVKRLPEPHTLEELEQHHRVETEFLIRVCRELAARLLKINTSSKIFRALRGLCPRAKTSRALPG